MIYYYTKSTERCDLFELEDARKTTQTVLFRHNHRRKTMVHNTIIVEEDLESPLPSIVFTAQLRGGRVQPGTSARLAFPHSLALYNFLADFVSP